MEIECKGKDFFLNWQKICNQKCFTKKKLWFQGNNTVISHREIMGVKIRFSNSPTIKHNNINIQRHNLIALDMREPPEERLKAFGKVQKVIV